tara:strand:+ start:5932 stop:6246 length:315 start_codon:yes stop_codon:yes gene_type:complete
LGAGFFDGPGILFPGVLGIKPPSFLDIGTSDFALFEVEEFSVLGAPISFDIVGVIFNCSLGLMVSSVNVDVLFIGFVMDKLSELEILADLVVLLLAETFKFILF